jgi:hypothetical protein
MPSLKPAPKPGLEDINQPLELLTELQLRDYIAAVQRRRDALEWALESAQNKAIRNGGDIDTRNNIRETSETWLKMMQFEVELQTRLAQREVQAQRPDSAALATLKNPLLNRR